MHYSSAALHSSKNIQGDDSIDNLSERAQTPSFRSVVRAPPRRRNRPRVRAACAACTASGAAPLVLQVEDGPVEHIVVLEPFPVEELLEQALRLCMRR